MKTAGYETYHHGKRGNTAPLIQSRFDHNRYLMNDQAERTSGEPGKEIVDAAMEFVSQRSGDRPFFMYLAFGNPHDPRVAAPKYLEQYQADALPLPKNFRPQHPFDIGSNTVRDETLLPWPRTEAGVRRTHHEYYATITAMDFHIGRLLALLQERGLLENTLVVFSADQGISIGSHGLLGKQNLYDPAMKAPLVFAGPGIPHGSSDALVYLFDIYPTVCDLVGADVPSAIDGRSAKPRFAEPRAPHREELLLSYMTTQRAIRTDRWKLIRYPQVDVTQLFDLQADPDETRDRSRDPDQAQRVTDLLSRVKALQAKFGDSQPLTVPNPQPAAWSPPKG
jgi:arylsulfatase A-like enzyme